MTAPSARSTKVNSLALATPQTLQDHMEGHPPPLLPQRIMAGQPQSGTAQPDHGRHQPLPLPGRSHPATLAGHRTVAGKPTWDLRRARCGVSRTAGSVVTATITEATLIRQDRQLDPQWLYRWTTEAATALRSPRTARSALLIVGQRGDREQQQ
jgi:hypothetical protein